MKIALVHDDLIQHGGAERLVEAIMEIWPKADVFTSMATTSWKSQIPKLKTSFMQNFPFKERLYRHYFLFYPLAFESFDFADYDVVISSSTRFAHAVVTRPGTIHIAYINTPPRMFWEPFGYFKESPWFRALLSPFLSYLRLWDFAAAQRPDVLIANSKTPQARIKKYYRRDSGVIYPFVELSRFEGKSNVQLKSQNYYLIVSRLAAWKRIDTAIEACNRLRLPLKIVGEGPDRARLRKLAGPTVEFLGRLTDEEVVRYYKGCRAFLFPQKEDFGITPLEAMACGKPVVAYRAGGALETVVAGKTGEFFYPQTVEALVQVLKGFQADRYDFNDCVRQARRFSKQRFKDSLKSLVEAAAAKHDQFLRQR